MHPIEHLRYIARAQGADPAALVVETAQALSSLRFDSSGLVVTCRRIVERHPYTGALWWLCASVSTSVEPFDAVWELAEQMRSDRTAAELGAALPDDATVVTIGAPDLIGEGLARRGDIRVLALDVGHTATPFVRGLERHDVDYEPVDAGTAGLVTRIADVVLIEALAVDGERVIAPIGSSTIAAAAQAWGTPVWLISGVGRRLPSAIIDHMERTLEASTGDQWDGDVEILPTSLVTNVIGPTGKMPMGPPAVAPECPAAHELFK